MKIIFFLINMNLGGTEKSLLNLISSLPEDYEIDVLLLEEKGLLLNRFPKNVKLKQIENHEKINEFIRLGCRRFAFNELKRGNPISFLKNIFVFSLYKINVLKHPYYGIKNLINDQPHSYDIAVAYAGPHDFISYYTLNYIHAQQRFQWIHFDIERVTFHRRFANEIYRYYDKIVCVSDLVRKNLEERLNENLKAKIQVFHNVLNYKEIQEKSREYKSDFNSNLVNILTVGRLTKEKGHLEFLGAIERLKNDGLDFQWTIVGDGGKRAEIEREIQKLNLENYVRLIGSKENPYPYFRDCDIYLQPSLYEGHALSIIEAKFFKKPILANDFAGIKDEIQNGINGIICKPETEEQYKELKKLIQSEGLREKLIDSLNEGSKKRKIINPFLQV